TMPLNHLRNYPSMISLHAPATTTSGHPAIGTTPPMATIGSLAHGSPRPMKVRCGLPDTGATTTTAINMAGTADIGVATSVTTAVSITVSATSATVTRVAIGTTTTLTT